MRNRQHGFTYVEISIVAAICAILAAIAVPNFLEAQVRAKVSRSVADMTTIKLALDAYRSTSACIRSTQPRAWHLTAISPY